MTRDQEWKELLREAAEIPEELELRINRTVCHAKKAALRKNFLRTFTGLAAAVAVFMILVNVSAPFALAVSRVPIVKSLVEAVAFDPSLKAAVANNDVQLVRQSKEENGIRLEIGYLIADKRNLSIFYRISDKQGRDLLCIPDLLDSEGTPLKVSGVYGEEKGGTEESPFLKWKFHAGEDGVIQESMCIKVSVYTADRQELLACFDMPLSVNSDFLYAQRILGVNETVTVLGQKLTVDRIEIYPTNTRIVWHTDPENSAWLTDLPFYLTDETGVRVDGISNGTSGMGGDWEKNQGEIWLESAWYDTADRLFVHLETAAALPKDQDTVILYEDGTLEGLPEYLQQTDTAMNEFQVFVEKGECRSVSPVFLSYTDASGNKEYFSENSIFTGSEKGYYNSYPIPSGVDWPVKLQLFFAPGKRLETPIVLETEGPETGRDIVRETGN